MAAGWLTPSRILTQDKSAFRCGPADWLLALAHRGPDVNYSKDDALSSIELVCNYTGRRHRQEQRLLDVLVTTPCPEIIRSQLLLVSKMAVRLSTTVI